jgi:hypothetical protein
MPAPVRNRRHRLAAYRQCWADPSCLEASVIAKGRTLLVVGVACVSWACAARHHPVPTGVQDDAEVLESLRGMARAQAVYQVGNFGFYDTPECIATPAKCIPWYQRSGSAVPPPTVETVSRRRGYVWRFVPGKAPAAGNLPADASRSSLLEWAYTAVPIEGGERPWYCIDSSQRVCRYVGRAVVRAARGRCPLPCARVE